MTRSLMSAMKTGIARGARSFGFKLERLGAYETDDDALYRGFSQNALANRCFLNVGAGQFQHRFWRTLDYSSAYYENAIAPMDYNMDLTREQPFPISDGELEAVYCSHTIEHLPDRAVLNLLGEARRVLRPKGVLRLVCPDADMMYRAYCYGDKQWWRYRFDFSEDRGVSQDIKLEELLLAKISPKNATAQRWKRRSDQTRPDTRCSRTNDGRRVS